MKQLKKPNIQMQRKILKSDATDQLLSLEKRKIELFEKMFERRKTSEELEADEDYHLLMSLLPHLHDVPKPKKLAIRTRIQQVLMEEVMKEVVPSPTSAGSSSVVFYNSITERNATEPNPTIIFINGLSFRIFIVCIDSTYQFSSVYESFFQ
jgi:hypothetical protein